MGQLERVHKSSIESDVEEVDWSSKDLNQSPEEKFLQCCQDTFLYQHVKQPTRARGQDEPSLIDLVFTNEENMISQIEHLNPLGSSGHCTLLSQLFKSTIQL